MTLTSSPSLIVFPSGGSSLAKLPGNSSLKILPKSPLTLDHVLCSASFLYSSRFEIVSSIFFLSLMTVLIMFLRLTSFFSTLSIMLMTLGLILFFIPWKRSAMFLSVALHSAMFCPLKSYGVPVRPKCSLSSMIHSCSFSSAFRLWAAPSRSL
ncbi:hypothetical protein GQ43DRAFT_236923 [Delitschia confertaspora ATCC 74209]|uniref:Uncharacterized protein n=1 Tax=Delitschia confertaspora ATCC 74209 TaxID=1513339 RepID=A0A9P4MUN4_9PLEO|nr:hypothetical protein GQ43DRAFT_236923 [Delitschia confertaspora ATCC 74209]